MKKLLLCIALLCFIFYDSKGQATCGGALALTIGVEQCGNSAGQAGDFPNAGGAPTNPCNSNYNDDEYWFSYTATATGEKLDILVDSISDTWAGVFVLDNCPAASPNCIASARNTGSTADLAVTTPGLIMGTTYYIVITNYGTPNSTFFCLNSAVIPAPSCPDPPNFGPSNVDITEVTMDWGNTGATSYTVEYGAAGFTPGSGMTMSVATNTATIGGLTQGTSYDFYVMGICGPDSSALVGPETVRTLSPGSNCVSSVTLSPGTEQCGNSAGQPGDFPNGGGAPTNPCNTSYNDDEYWFEYTAVETGEKLQILVDSISDTYAGVFVLDNCPTSSPNCVASARNSNSTADLSLTTPDLIAGTTYYIVIVNWGAPNSTFFCLNSTVIPVPSCFDPSNVAVDNITFTTASVRWNSDASASYVVEYDTTGFAPGSGMKMTTTDTSLNMTGLMAGTAYDVYVQGICGADSSQQVGPMGFTTICQEIATYCQGFENAPTGQLNGGTVDCWSNTNSVNPEWIIQTGSTVSGSTGPSGAATGNNYIFLETSSPAAEGEADTLTGPVVDISSLTTPRLAYNIHMYGQTMGTLRTELSDDMGATWNLIDTIVGQQQTSSSEDWIPKAYDLAAYGATVMVRFIGIRGSDFYSDMAIDDICFEDTPQCPSPTALLASNITGEGAELSWTDPGSASSFLIVVDTVGFNPDNATAVSVAASPYTYNTGMPLTAYEFYVKAICGTDSTAWSGPKSFTTLCAAIIPPNTETFDAFIPQCWDEASNGDPTTGPMDLGSGDWRADGFAGGSNPSASINLFNTGTSDWLLTPSYDLSGGSGYGVDFDISLNQYNSTNGGNLGSDDQIQFLISTDTGATWTNIITWDNSSTISNIGEDFFHDLSAYTGLVQFAFWGTEGTVDDPEDVEFFVDNFRVRITPACPEPENLTADLIGTDTVNFKWTPKGSETDWIVSYGPFGTAPEDGTMVATTADSAIIPGLNAATIYGFYVKAACNATDSSVWTGPVFKITPQANDVCSGAYALSCGDIVIDSTYYTVSSINPFCGTSPGNYNLWYSFDGNDQEVTVSTVNPQTNFNTKLNVYANSCNNLDCIGGNDNFGGTDQSSYTFLAESGTTYYILVSGSGTAYGTFELSVSCEPCYDPTSLSVSDITNNSADVSWQHNPNASGFVIEYGLNGFTLGSGTQVTTGTPGGPITLAGLMSDSMYQVYVYEMCGGNNSDTLLSSFTVLPACPNAANLGATDITANSATLTWSSVVTSGSWIVEYGPDGFTLGGGTQVTSSDTFKMISGLMGNTAYDAYVRVVCTPTDSSASFVGPLSFATPCAVITPDYLDTFNVYPATCWSEGNLGSTAAGPADELNSDWVLDDFANNVGGPFGKSAKLNAYNVEEEWMLSPQFNLSAGNYELKFNIAATEWNSSTTQAVWADADTLYLVYTEDGTNWMTLDKWSSGKIPSATGDTAVYDISSITGATVQFGFYYSSNGADSPEDIDVFIDNFEIKAQTAPCPPVLNVMNPIDQSNYHGVEVNVSGTVMSPNTVTFEYQNDANFTDFDVELGAEVLIQQADCP